jgi:N-methylhydantoinase A/acetophenone carboxylase
MKFGGQLNVKRATSPVLRVRSEADVVAIREAFEREYAGAYSPMGLTPEAGIEIYNFVLWARLPSAKPELPRFALEGTDPGAARGGSRRAYWQDLGWVDTPVFRLDLLRPGNELHGPAIVEAEDTTLVVEPEWHFRIGEYFDGILELQNTDLPTPRAAADHEAPSRDPEETRDGS